jgi:hypothetical protein
MFMSARRLLREGSALIDVDWVRSKSKRALLGASILEMDLHVAYLRRGTLIHDDDFGKPVTPNQFGKTANVSSVVT